MVRQNDDELSCQKYGVPFYGAAWVPPSAAVKEDKSESPAAIRHVVLAGGGGEGSSGIPNAFLVTAFDLESNSLSNPPVAKLGTASDLPYRIAVHPGSEGIVCSFPKSCRLFQWDSGTNTDEPALSLIPSERVLVQLEDVGQQLSSTFNDEGNLFAVGGEDGKLRVFKWPIMECILNEDNAHTSVKDLDFSSDGKFLVSVGSGPGRIWDITTSASLATLPKENDEIFGFCRFSRAADTDQILYTTAMRDKGGSIVKWNTNTWRRISSSHIVRDPISAFNVSPDGKLLAIGTIQGDVFIIRSAGMRVHTVVKKAHLGLVTALAFSPDSRALLSASLDSSARVTLIKDKKQGGTNLWVILLIILLAIASYYAKTKELLPLKL
ncbi:SEC12-like protein 2 [Andrographis paniculata]|uniref:SEC12-like protein 2 n=1 Tax=Andrographis paniculata TaxID=175694 RepID=UPI0021E92CF6|nr:SEC12-like protein 2 [Andrographis paniculata]